MHDATRTRPPARPGPAAWGLLALLAVAGPSWSAGEISTTVPSQCIHDMGEWGEGAVHECIRQNLPAAEALDALPKSYTRLIEACTRVHGSFGWAAVKACVDRADKPPEAR